MDIPTFCWHFRWYGTQHGKCQHASFDTSLQSVRPSGKVRKIPAGTARFLRQIRTRPEYPVCTSESKIPRSGEPACLLLQKNASTVGSKLPGASDICLHFLRVFPPFQAIAPTGRRMACPSAIRCVAACVPQRPGMLTETVSFHK